MENTNAYISLEVLAVTLELPQTYLKRRVNDGTIPYLDVNGRKRFQTASVVAALNKHKEVRDEFLDLENLAAKLELPEEYLLNLAKNNVIPCFVDNEGHAVFRLISVIDILVKCKPQDCNMNKTFSLYARLMGFHNGTKIKE